MNRAVVLSDKQDPGMLRAVCPCGWVARRADYGMADACRRARAHRCRPGHSAECSCGACVLHDLAQAAVLWVAQ